MMCEVLECEVGEWEGFSSGAVGGRGDVTSGGAWSGLVSGEGADWFPSFGGGCGVKLTKEGRVSKNITRVMNKPSYSVC